MAVVMNEHPKTEKEEAELRAEGKVERAARRTRELFGPETVSLVEKWKGFVGKFVEPLGYRDRKVVEMERKLPSFLVHLVPVCLDWDSPPCVFGTVETKADPDYPYGQWSGRLEKTEVEGLYSLVFLANEAPVDELREGDVLRFSRPPLTVGYLTVVRIIRDVKVGISKEE